MKKLLAVGVVALLTTGSIAGCTTTEQTTGAGAAAGALIGGASTGTVGGAAVGAAVGGAAGYVVGKVAGTDNQCYYKTKSGDLYKAACPKG